MLLFKVTLNGKDSAWQLCFCDLERDHSPWHVHVYQDGRLIVKWDLDHQVPMKGKANRQILRLIEELLEEGLL